MVVFTKFLSSILVSFLKCGNNMEWKPIQFAIHLCKLYIELPTLPLLISMAAQT